jgi:protein CpxP
MTIRSVISAALAAMLVLGASVLAQESGEKHKAAKKSPAGVSAELDSMSQQLNLTEDQKAKIGPLLDDQHKKIMDSKADASLSPEGRKAKSKEIRQNTRQQIRALLNPDQQKKLDEMPKGRGKKVAQPTKETQ